MNRFGLFMAFCLLFFLQDRRSIAQDRYWIFLSDKENQSFDPYAYFSPKTIEKRQRIGFPLNDISDLPVRPDYIETLRTKSVEVFTASRWLNAVSVSANKNQLVNIRKLSFVTGVSPITLRAVRTKTPFKISISPADEKLRKAQIESLGGQLFEQKGIDGSGVRIAIFDGGFPGVDTSPLFEKLREENRIIATWDFVKDREFVYDYNSHGTAVLTCIAGEIEGKKFGLGTGAEFLLARTEINREVFSEEENWLAAMEWADKNGADIINSSLGYTHHRYKQKQMDGKSTLVTRAAGMAAARGMLVVNAAGNDGSGFWKVVGAPADADSILSVGGINPGKGYKIDFSSVGPTYDGRMKPNIAAFGKVTSSNHKKIKESFGTSFSAPLVSGFAACVMQMNPEWTNMDAYREIQKSGHLYPYFDYAHGYGVPQAAYFTGDKTEVSPTFDFMEENDSLKIVFRKRISDKIPDTISLTMQAQKFSDIIENLSELKEFPESIAPENQDTLRYDLDDPYLYFHISGENETDILKRYSLVKIKNNTAYFGLPLNEIEGAVLRVFHKGYFSEYRYSD